MERDTGLTGPAGLITTIVIETLECACINKGPQGAAGIQGLRGDSGLTGPAGYNTN